MGDRSIEELLSALHEARLGGDLERLCALFDAEAQFRIAGNSDVRPVAISARGAEAIRAWLAILLKSFRLSAYERIGFLVQGERAAVHWRADIHSKITGVTVRTELIDWVQVRASRIVAYTELFVAV